MINYRNIFNPSYNYIGLIFIFLIALIIIIIKKDILASIYQISKISIIAGILTLIIAILLNFIMNSLIISSYKVFIEIITKNVIESLYLYSIIVIVTSGLINLMLKFGLKQNEEAK